MNYKEYINIFKTKDEYITQNENKGNFITNLFKTNRFIFYYKFGKVILHGAKIARQGLYDKAAWIDNSLDNLVLIEKSGGLINIDGMENLREDVDKGMVIIANHMSTLETLVLPSIIQSNRNVTFIVKDTLIEGNNFGAIMRAVEPIIVGRKNPREDLEHVLKEGEKKLRNGTSLIIFPQSTRDSVFDPKGFNTLGIKLAKRAKVKVIPLALKTDFWGNGKLIKEVGKIDPKKKIYFSFEKPIGIKSNGKEEHKMIIDFISGKQEEWKKS